VAQEKAQAFNGRKINGQFQFDRDKTVYVNHYYFYIDDEELGPLFVKVCSYAPWSIKLCLNGHEWAKRQLEKRGIRYEALDNGFLSCSQPAKLQQICDSLGPQDIDRVFRKWLSRIPLPLRPQDRRAGYDWDLSIWQMEVSLMQIFDRPLRGREFFEEIIRDKLDLGRPDRVQLVFDRGVTKKTPGQFRTRVIQDGVHPSLHISFKNFDLKQYFKEGRGCRTEGTFRNPNDHGGAGNVVLTDLTPRRPQVVPSPYISDATKRAHAHHASRHELTPARGGQSDVKGAEATRMHRHVPAGSEQEFISRVPTGPQIRVRFSRYRVHIPYFNLYVTATPMPTENLVSSGIVVTPLGKLDPIEYPFASVFVRPKNGPTVK